MQVKVTKLKRLGNGDWFARKAIPRDLRSAYKVAFGKSQEERFRRASTLAAGMAKTEFADWLAEIEQRIEHLLSRAANAEQSLTMRQIHSLIGRWQRWFPSKLENEAWTAEAIGNAHEQYRTVAERARSLGCDDGRRGTALRRVAKFGDTNFWGELTG